MKYMLRTVYTNAVDAQQKPVQICHKPFYGLNFNYFSSKAALETDSP